jgi:hypothetical protein
MQDNNMQPVAQFLASLQYKCMKIILLIAGLLVFGQISATVVDTPRIPLSRQLIHQRIQEAQGDADKLDYKKDNFLKLTPNEEINMQVTDAIFRHVTGMRYSLEADNRLKNNSNKLIGCLRLVREMVTAFSSNYKQKKIGAVYVPMLVNGFHNMLNAAIDSQSIAPYIAESPHEVAVILAELFKDNIGYQESRKLIFLKFIALNPDKILQTIRPYAQEPFADSLVVIACRNNPVQLYSYAQATNLPEGRLIQRNTDKMVKAVAELSQTPNALFYFPFLDDILKGRNTIEEIKKYVGDGETSYDSVGYYKLLVRTAIDYHKRIINRAMPDTPIAMYGPNGLQEVLAKKSLQHFAAPINALHEENNPAVRFKAVEPLGPVELYYVMVMTEADIYTSSYKYCFGKMIERLGKKPRTDSLLMAVSFDYFKKFIKMAAGYNRLDTFLKAMPKGKADTLMMAFVSRLEESRSNEEAVDVADSYASVLGNKQLTAFILNEIKRNEQRCISSNDRNGMLVYGLLKNICLSATDTTIDLTKLYGIPPVYSLDYKALSDDSGRVVTQVFFYGDKDGKMFFPPFVNSFPPALWKKTENNEWVEFRSTRGKPVFIYANKPLDNDTNLDSAAQAHLTDYLLEKGMAPSILVHRGHSYHLPYTIRQLLSSEKLVLLGSCGGYKNLSQVLETAPEAHIISTKQIGAGDINRPIINYITGRLREGKKIDWIEMWTALDKLFARDPSKDVRERWLDYVPPHKNLGALFLKAYTRQKEGE